LPRRERCKWPWVVSLRRGRAGPATSIYLRRKSRVSCDERPRDTLCSSRRRARSLKAAARFGALDFEEVGTRRPSLPRWTEKPDSGRACRGVGRLGPGAGARESGRDHDCDSTPSQRPGPAWAQSSSYPGQYTVFSHFLTLLSPRSFGGVFSIAHRDSFRFIST
jgi:hypothetical protein